MSRTLTLVLCVAILAVGAGVTVLIFRTEPTAQREGATKQTAMLVDVTSVERGTFRPTIRAMGTVVAARDVTLAARVDGQVLAIAETFTPGGFVREGELLVRLDPADHETALRQRRSELQQARADLAIEEGRRDVAIKDYELLGRELPADQRDLVLRGPQIESTRARVEHARAAVRQAELHLERTQVRAPFDAHVLRRDVDVGSQVDPGEPLARLVGLDEYWVEATVPLSELRWLSFRADDGAGSRVIVRSPTAWGAEAHRVGRLDRLVGALEDGTRMARVIVSVPDPLARTGDDAPVLMIGAFVEVSMKGEPLEDVVRVDRDLVRKDDTVWVMEDGMLRIRDITITLRDAQAAYVSSGLDGDERIVTTSLATVRDGAELRLSGSAASEEASDAEAEAATDESRTVVGSPAS